MGIKLKQFVFALDRPPVYRAGDLVTGYCIIELDGHMNLGQLVITLEGNAHCAWSESHSRPIYREGKRVSYSETKIISSNYNIITLSYNPGQGIPKN